MPRIELSSEELTLLDNPKDHLEVAPSRIVAGRKVVESLGLGMGNIVRQEYFFKDLESGKTTTKKCKPGTFDPCGSSGIVIWYFQDGTKGFFNQEKRDAIFVSAIGMNGQVVTGGRFQFWQEKKGRRFENRKDILMQLILRHQDNLSAFARYFTSAAAPEESECA